MALSVTGIKTEAMTTYNKTWSNNDSWGIDRGLVHGAALQSCQEGLSGDCHGTTGFSTVGSIRRGDGSHSFLSRDG
eukprot:2225929-Amphidinium_carterae.1